MYVLTGTDVNGCTSLDTVSITVNPLPTVNLGNDTTSICQGDSVLLDAGSGHTNYLWSTGETTQTIYASSSGTYSVSVGNGTPVSNSNSLSFDGTDDFTQLANPINFGTNSFTVSIDCYLNSFEGNDSEPYSYIVGTPVSNSNNDHGFKIQTSSSLSLIHI